jgi:hypothetical protein
MLWEKNQINAFFPAKHLFEAMLLLELQVLDVQSVDTINHGLHQLNLGVAQTMFV